MLFRALRHLEVLVIDGSVAPAEHMVELANSLQDVLLVRINVARPLLHGAAFA